MTFATRVLILPGLFNSGPEHWQSRWEAEHPDFVRVEQRDWETHALLRALLEPAERRPPHWQTKADVS